MIRNKRFRHLKPRKKTIFLFFFLLIAVILLLIKIIKPVNHTDKYQLNGYQITQKYYYKKDLYIIKVTKDQLTFTYKRYNKKYEKNIINKIDVIKNDDTYCAKISSVYNLEPFCIKESKINNHNLIDYDLQLQLGYKGEDEHVVKHPKVTLYNLMKKDYYLWNYHGFTLINNKDYKEIRLFKNDTYDAEIITNLGDYILVANYDQDYYFNKFIVYNMKKKKDSEFKTNKDISFNSEILGNYKKSVYLVDKKHEREYEIVPEYSKIRLLKKPVYLNDGLHYTKVKKIINNEVTWNNNYLINYKIIDNKLYLNYDDTDILVSNNAVDKIMYQTDLGVYYLVLDTLYYYEPNKLETRILKYSEWQFNKNIKIIIY